MQSKDDHVVCFTDCKNKARCGEKRAVKYLKPGWLLPSKSLWRNGKLESINPDATGQQFDLRPRLGIPSMTRPLSPFSITTVGGDVIASTKG